MMDQWKKKHMPHYITESFYLPEWKASIPVKNPEAGSLLLPDQLKAGELYPLMIWCSDTTTGTYERVISRLRTKDFAVFFYHIPELSDPYPFPSEPMEREKEAAARLLEAVDVLCAEHNWIDPEQLYIGGIGSGAQTAAFILSERTPFRRAVLGPAVYNAATAFGTGSIGFEPHRGESLLNFYETGVQHSVLNRIDTMKTPILFLYDRADQRIGLEQVEEFYSSMKDRNPEIPCKMAISPEYGPGMSDLSDTFLEIISDWMKEQNHED